MAFPNFSWTLDARTPIDDSARMATTTDDDDADDEDDEDADVYRAFQQVSISPFSRSP